MRNFFRFFRLSTYLVGTIMFFTATISNARPLVVTSIKPLQLLVAAVGENLVESQLLLPSSVSPHLYHLRPSDRMRLQSADVVIWVGPELERFLTKTLSLLPDKNTLELAAALNGGQRQSRVHDLHTESDSHAHGHDNPHIWLNPELAVKMAKAIADRLSAIDGAHAEQYQHNWQQFLQRISVIDKQIKRELQSISDQRYMVLHDAYGHFEAHYGMQHMAAFTVSPDRKPGVRHMLNIREKVRSRGVRCLFREPQYQSSMEDLFSEHEGVTVGLLDPLASSIAVSATGYEEFFVGFSREFKSCLTR
jgi:zinc transport system substrate-binding protein